MRIDHLVYVVPDLFLAMEEMEQLLGIAPVFGGQHLTQGTHNALVDLYNDCYLELLAADPSQSDFSAPRWMGVDLIQQAQLTRWALKTNDLESEALALQQYHPLMGQRKTGSRKKADGTTLRWELTLPLAEPAIELCPFLINWQGAEHPTKTLEKGCTLLALEAEHPQPTQLRSTWDALGIDWPIGIAASPKLRAIIDTPKGQVILE